MKTAISIPDELYQKVISYANGRKFSTTVSELIRRGLSAEGIGVLPEYDQSMTRSITKVIPPEWIAGIESDIADLRNRLESMSETITLNENNANFSAQQIAYIQSREIKREREIQALQTKIEKIEHVQAQVNKVIPEVQPEVIPKESHESIKPVSHQKDQPPNKHVADMMESRIALTPDLQKKIITHITLLEKEGMTRHVIADKISMPEGSFKKLMSKSNPLKSIGRQELTQLMAMTAPGTSHKDTNHE